MSPSELYDLVIKLQNAGLSQEQIQAQMKFKDTSPANVQEAPMDTVFDPYNPPVSGRNDQAAYMRWRRQALKSGAELASDRPMVNQYNNTGDTAKFNQKAIDVNKTAIENLYEVMPEVKGQYGSAQVGALAGAAIPIAVHYANQATHGEFNPLDIKSAGEGSDIVPRGPEEQQYNSLQEMYRQKKLQSLR